MPLIERVGSANVWCEVTGCWSGGARGDEQMDSGEDGRGGKGGGGKGEGGGGGWGGSGSCGSAPSSTTGGATLNWLCRRGCP